MTLLVKFGDDRLEEYPVSNESKLRDNFTNSIRPWYFPIGEVYGYIINRKPEFRHPYYGWALPR